MGYLEQVTFLLGLFTEPRQLDSDGSYTHCLVRPLVTICRQIVMLWQLMTTRTMRNTLLKSDGPQCIQSHHDSSQCML